jgi:phosphoribosylanthranilate isomerase
MQTHSSSPRVKICGITSVDDALIAAEAGADAIGLVFYEPSPRAVSVDTAITIARSVGPFVSVVGLFVNAQADEISNILSRVSLHVLQFHGNESLTFCEQFQRPYIKAVRMKPEIDIDQAISAYPSALGVLLDAYQKGVPGGTGETFDWGRIPSVAARLAADYPPIVLAGGLTPSNVIQAVQQTSPYAVDVSGGVEQALGKKDQQKVIDFIKNAKAA